MIIIFIIIIIIIIIVIIIIIIEDLKIPILNFQSERIIINE
jgi:hypothetical protein